MTDKPEIEHKKITDFTPDNANANKGTERGLRMLDDSLSTVGAGRSIVVDKHGRIIGGNKTTERAIDNGFEDAIVVHTNGDKLVVVQRDDLDLYSNEPDNKARLMAYYDNRVGQLDLDWSAEQLLADNQLGVPLDKFFSGDELASHGITSDDSSQPTGDAEAQLNRAHELVDKFQVERGQVWIIDRHRLMCGDSYSADDLDLLLDGAKPDLLNTDPPYGISIVKPTGNGSTAAIGGAKAFGSTGDKDRKGKSAIAERNRGNGVGKTGGGRGDESSRHAHHANDVGRGNPANIVQSNIYPVIEGDDTPFEPAFLLDLAPIIVLWGANYYADKLPTSSGWIVWDKRENITRNNFADCELAWTNQNKPARIFYHLWNGLHKGSQHGERRVHPTEKPVALFREIGELLAPRGLWLDLFAGSGAQIVAAHESGATCYALEYEPLYVATILQRMVDLGYEPVKAN